MSCVAYNSICSITDTHSLYILYITCTEPGAAVTCDGFCANVQKKKSPCVFLPTSKDTRRGLLCGSCVFLGYHVPQKDGGKGQKAKGSNQNTQKFSRSRNICRSSIEHMYLKAPNIMNDKKIPTSIYNLTEL